MIEYHKHPHTTASILANEYKLCATLIPTPNILHTIIIIIVINNTTTNRSSYNKNLAYQYPVTLSLVKTPSNNPMMSQLM